MIIMKQPLCLSTLTSGGEKQKHLVPESDPDPVTEVKTGDLYLLTNPPPDVVNRSGEKKRGGGGGGRSGGGPSRYPVHVTVYRSSYGHYAVLTASLRSPATYLNLRTCLCRPCSLPSRAASLSPTSTTTTTITTIRVELGGGEGQVIYFEVPTRDLGKGSGVVMEWVEAFQGKYGGVPPSPGSISPSLSPHIPRSPIMPTLQESLEEEEVENAEEIIGLG